MNRDDVVGLLMALGLVVLGVVLFGAWFGALS